MIELYENISDELRKTAEIAWKIAMLQRDPLTAASFLDNVTKYYQHLLTEEEVDFLNFFFQMKMEMMKK